MDANAKTSSTLLTTFKSGANRIEVPEAFEAICPTAEAALSEIYAEGILKYGRNNWTKGLPTHSTLRHLRRHLNLWQRGDRTEPHLAKVAWGIFTLIHFEQNCSCGREPNVSDHEVPPTRAKVRRTQAGKRGRTHLRRPRS